MARKLRIAVSVFFGVLTVALLVLWPFTYLRPLSVTFPGAAAAEQREFYIRDGRIGIDTITQLPRSIQAVHFRLWFCAAVALFLADMPWIIPRFSLRALLIATTLVAVVLGLAVWAGR